MVDGGNLSDQSKHSMRPAGPGTSAAALVVQRANVALYEDYFGLSEKPFALTPNPSFVFYSEPYGTAEEAILYGLAQNEGLMVVTGDPGTGKTLLCHALRDKLTADGHRVALISNPFLSGLEVLQALVAEFQLGDAGMTSRRQLVDLLRTYFLELAALGKSCVVIVDEAQQLNTGFLEQIRVLSNLETDRDKLVQIVLVGQSGLLEIMRAPELAGLYQRVSVRCTLTHLSREETARYIDHRLNVAGARGRVTFHKNGVKRLHRSTGGIPRLINLACDRAMLSGFADQSTSIDDSYIRHAIAAIGAEDMAAGSAIRSSSRMPMTARRALSWLIGTVSTTTAFFIGLAIFWFGLDGGAEVLAWQGARATSARDAEQAYVSIARQHPESRQRERALLLLAQLQIAKGDAREALRWMRVLNRDYPDGRQGGERQYWMARALLTSGDTSSACSMTPALNPGAAGMLGPAYSSMHRQCEAFTERTRGTASSGEVSTGNHVDTVAVAMPAGSSQLHGSLP